MLLRRAEAQSGKDTGLTLIQTMLLVMILGLLLTWVVSLWLERSGNEAPGTSTSSAAEISPVGQPR